TSPSQAPLSLNPRLRHALWAASLLLLLTAQRPLPPTIAAPAPSADAAPGVSFVDVTRAAGLASFRHVSGDIAKNYIIEATGSGVALWDYDNDGWLDVYLVNGSTWAALAGREPAPSAALFHNNHDGTFTDVSAAAGVANGRWGQGVCEADFDNDGWPDLYVTKFGRNRLYRNSRQATVAEAAESAGVPADCWCAAGCCGVAFFDFDDDGRFALFVANDSTPNYLYRTQGAGTFKDVSYTSGAALDETGREQAHMGVAIGDYDNDGRDDIHVTNFAGDSNVLYHNEGHDLFSDVSYAAGIGRPSVPFLGWGTSFLDYDNDGRLDLVVA